MCFTRLKHLVCVTLLLLLIDKYVLYSSAFPKEKPHNGSDDIERLFHETHFTKQFNESMLKGNISGNFAEGGTIVTNPNTSTLSNTQNFINSKNISISSTEAIIPITVSVKNVFEKESESNSTTSATSTTAVNKLNDTGINLYLGVPEVIHVNGTSSIKPRKGVYFNKIVPRKGVDIDNETNSNIDPCFWVTKNECYSSVDFVSIVCYCCEKGNNLGKIVVQQSVMNCSSCKTLTPHPLGEKTSCKNLCCSNKLLDKETYSISTSEDFFDVISHNSSERKMEVFKKENVSRGMLMRKSKPKPTITKVPYDVEAVTEMLGKRNKDVFVPVVVSIFLLPLLGVLVFFVWKRTKDYWEKRYYKRMDFLIDGMYND